MTEALTTRVSSLTNSIGVNAHIDQLGSSYGSSNVVAQMSFLGINNMRTETPYDDQSQLLALGAAGIKLDLVPVIAHQNSVNLASEMALIDSVAPDVVSVEGPNEINTDPITYNGLSGAAAADTFQMDLYNAIHSDPKLTGVSVLPFSLSVGGSVAGFGNVAAYADYGNVHGYASSGVPPYYMLSYAVSSVTTAPGKQAIMTETGNYTDFDGASGVSQDVQAKWMLDTVLENSANGLFKTYIYQLEDEGADAPGTAPYSENHYGLFNDDGTPKLAATAIHNLTTILADPGANASTFTPGTLNYTVSGLPQYNGFQNVYAKSNGSFDIALWYEPQFYNAATGVESAVTPATVTIALGGAYNVSVFDPIIGAAAVSTSTDVSSVQVALGTDPLIVQVTPVVALPALTDPVTLGSGPASLTVGISEDAWLGDAQYTIAVDGVQIGGVQTATALHGQGQSQAVTLDGSFGGGTHLVTIDFLNDAYGGTPQTDRNLYVDTLTAGGVTEVVNGALLSSGSQSFTSPALPSGPQLVTLGSGPRSLTVGISEDAWQGDAQFTVAVDGIQVGGVQTATALHEQGQSQQFALEGNFSLGAHKVSVNFLNDAYGGSAQQDRNLYVDTISAGGVINAVNSGLMINGSRSFASPIIVGAPAPAVTLGSGPQSIIVTVSEDAWQGNAQFYLSVDGKMIGGAQTTTAQRGAGQNQAFSIDGKFSSGPHVLTATFLNDAYGGTPQYDRNLYVDSITAGGVTQTVNAVLLSPGSKSFTTPAVSAAAAPAAIATAISATSVAMSTSPTLAFINATGATTLDAGTGSTPQTLTGGTGRTAFLLHAGVASGDTIANFSINTATGDFLELAGYGAGASLAQINPSTWQASSSSGSIQDLIHFNSPTNLLPANYLFR